MGVILDTHAFIWYIDGNSKLPPQIRDVIEISADKVYLSMASLWEIAIKLNIEKLTLDYDFLALSELLKQLSIQTLNITFTDLQIYRTLPIHHRDPFDRLIIAQAQNRSLSVISKDANFKQYIVPLLWN